MNNIACPIFRDYAEHDPFKEHTLPIKVICLAVAAQIPFGQMKPELITSAQHPH